VSSQGDHGSITDVPGVLVGHHQRRGRGWQTGTTAIVVPDGATPGVDVRGGGPGTRETDAVQPSKLVQTIHGICLTGGSAYGLRAADGLVDWLAERGLGFPIGTSPDEVVPVVPAAVIFDLARGGNFANHPTADFGRRAADNARRAQRTWGSVGAGTGARTGGLQGGVGTASATIPELGVVMGALAVVNSNGSAVDPSTGLPWEAAGWKLRRPPATERKAVQAALAAPPQPTNTTLGVVATSAALSKVEASSLAAVAHDGLARAIRPAHSLVDGDTVFSLATGAHDLPDRLEVDGSELDGPQARVTALRLLAVAAADTFAAACTHALLTATTLGDSPAYLDLCPSVRR
jgi:L-aminopeptidase/D-esterase-like protein